MNRIVLTILTCVIFVVSASAEPLDFPPVPRMGNPPYHPPLPRFEMPATLSYNPYPIMYRQAEAEYYRPCPVFYDNPGSGLYGYDNQARRTYFDVGFNALMTYHEVRKVSDDYTGDPITDLIALPFKLPGAIFGNLRGKGKR